MMKKIASILGLVTLAACGSDTNPVGPSITVPVPNVAGVYKGGYTSGLLVQWARQGDGVTGSFTCGASLTLSQATASDGQANLTGFLVIGAPCPPQSYDVRGFVYSDGSIRIFSGGAKPPQGQCPAVASVEYKGIVVSRQYVTDLSARGSANIDCPGPGEGLHRLDYILSLQK
jgi:hypothetical protein